MKACHGSLNHKIGYLSFLPGQSAGCGLALDLVLLSVLREAEGAVEVLLHQVGLEVEDLRERRGDLVVVPLAPAFAIRVQRFRSYT